MRTTSSSPSATDSCSAPPQPCDLDQCSRGGPSFALLRRAGLRQAHFCLLGGSVGYRAGRDRSLDTPTTLSSRTEASRLHARRREIAALAFASTTSTLSSRAEARASAGRSRGTCPTVSTNTTARIVQPQRPLLLQPRPLSSTPPKCCHLDRSLAASCEAQWRDLLLCHRDYFNRDPSATSSPNVASTGLPPSPSDAASNIPCDSSPRILRGARFVITTIRRPTNSSGAYHSAMPDKICRFPATPDRPRAAQLIRLGDLLRNLDFRHLQLDFGEIVDGDLRGQLCGSSIARGHRNLRSHRRKHSARLVACDGAGGRSVVIAALPPTCEPAVGSSMALVRGGAAGWVGSSVTGRAGVGVSADLSGASGRRVAFSASSFQLPASGFSMSVIICTSPLSARGKMGAREP